MLIPADQNNQKPIIRPITLYIGLAMGEFFYVYIYTEHDHLVAEISVEEFIEWFIGGNKYNFVCHTRKKNRNK